MIFSSYSKAVVFLKDASNDFLYKEYKIYKEEIDLPYQSRILRLIKKLLEERKLFKVGKLKFPYFPSHKNKHKKAKKLLNLIPVK